MNENQETIDRSSKFLSNATADELNTSTDNDEKRRHFTLATEVQQIIKSRNAKKSSGFDSLPNYTNKRLSPNFIIFVTALFNHINNSYFPTAWKQTEVIPVPKPHKNKQLVTSYRPIAQLSSLSKILEKIYDIRIRSFMQSKGLFDKFQFGFKACNSTIHPIAKLINDAATGLNINMPTVVTTLDFKSAFDTIWHKGLI